jgi:hypothetical protein
VSVFDEVQYPFYLPEAQYLHELLTQRYSDPDEAMLLARIAGISTLAINPRQSPLMLWKDILDEAAGDGLLRQLVQTVHDRLPGGPFKPFLSDLLANRPVATSGEPRDSEGAPAFVADDDSVTEPEAMLFRDDLTVPVGRLPALIATLQHLVELAPSVCKLTVDINGTEQFGTAFRVGQQTLLTNWHVVHRRKDEQPATAVSAEFGFDDDGRGGVLAASVVRCDPDSVVSNKDNDWAVIHTDDALRAEWRVLDMSTAAVPTIASSAFIVQHPIGQRKRVGIVRNQVSSVDDRVVHYLTDTDLGSSGSPVFDADGRLIALHHAGGRPTSVLGQAPIRKNEGIRISQVTADLAAAGVDVA